MATSVFCIANSTEQASRIVTQLKRSGFKDDDISVLFPDKSGTRDFAHEQHTKAPEGATAGVSAGGILGGAVGLLAGIGVLTVPGAAILITIGPLFAALSGVALGGAVGGIAGALIGTGIPEYEAKRYEGKVVGGNALISVHACTPEAVKRARDLFDSQGAIDINASSEARPDIMAVSLADN